MKMQQMFGSHEHQEQQRRWAPKQSPLRSAPASSVVMRRNSFPSLRYTISRIEAAMRRAGCVYELSNGATEVSVITIRGVGAKKTSENVMRNGNRMPGPLTPEHRRTRHHHVNSLSTQHAREPHLSATGDHQQPQTHLRLPVSVYN